MSRSSLRTARAITLLHNCSQPWNWQFLKPKITFSFRYNISRGTTKTNRDLDSTISELTRLDSRNLTHHTISLSTAPHSAEIFYNYHQQVLTICVWQWTSVGGSKLQTKKFLKFPNKHDDVNDESCRSHSKARLDSCCCLLLLNNWPTSHSPSWLRRLDLGELEKAVLTELGSTRLLRWRDERSLSRNRPLRMFRSPCREHCSRLLVRLERKNRQPDITWRSSFWNSHGTDGNVMPKAPTPACLTLPVPTIVSSFPFLICAFITETVPSWLAP